MTNVIFLAALLFPLCQAAKEDGCPDLEIPNGKLTYTINDFGVQSVSAVCNPGYRFWSMYTLLDIIGLWPRQNAENKDCLSAGTWGDDSGSLTGVHVKRMRPNMGPRCEKIRCNPLSNPIGSNFRIEYRDSDGKLMNGGKKSGTYLLGTYGIEPVMGTVAKYVCKDPKHILVEGSTTRLCEETGLWSGSSLRPICVASSVSCPPLNAPANGVIRYSRDIYWLISPNKKLYEGTSASYGCYQGHTLVGDYERNCQSDGTWSGEGSICNLTSAICPKLRKPDRGSILYKWNYGIMRFRADAEVMDNIIYEDTVATYSCEKPYTLTGDAKRTCQSDGTWTGQELDCKATCRKLIDPTDGEIRYTDSEGRQFTPGSKETSLRFIFEGTVAAYHCNPGYNRVSKSFRRTCQSDQTWTDGYSSCTPRDINLRLLGMLLHLVN